MIDLRNIRFQRGQRLILDDVSWRVGPGEDWAIVGANGSGKTTLLQVAVGYLWPNDGQVNVLGQRYGQVDLRELRRRIGWVSSAIAPMMHSRHSAMEIVLSGCFASTGLFDEASSQQVEQAKALIDQMGLGAVAGSSYAVLSLGEQQKVMIARALMAEPELLILDEACAGLDVSAREHLLRVIETMRNKSRRTTLIFVTHHIEEIPASFSHVLVLKAGRVLASGPKPQVLTSAMLSRAFDVHIEVEQKYGRYWTKIAEGNDQSSSPSQSAV